MILILLYVQQGTKMQSGNLIQQKLILAQDPDIVLFLPLPFPVFFLSFPFPLTFLALEVKPLTPSLDCDF